MILTQAVNPARDGAGAVRAASTFNKTARIRVLGYRCEGCLKFLIESTTNALLQITKKQYYVVLRGPHHKVRSTTKWSQRAETSQVEHKCVH